MDLDIKLGWCANEEGAQSLFLNDTSDLAITSNKMNTRADRLTCSFEKGIFGIQGKDFTK